MYCHIPLIYLSLFKIYYSFSITLPLYITVNRDFHNPWSSVLRTDFWQHDELDRCCYCSWQEFENKSDMQRHAKERHRADEKNHKCVLCLKSFPTSQQLTQHSLVHSNVRKYPCHYCEKSFKQLSHVQQHQRIHTGLSSYSRAHPA